MAVKTPIIWSDIHQDLIQDAQGNIKMSVNEASVRTSIDNILGTTPGERVFLPTFASGLKGLLFEPMNQSRLSQFTKSIRSAIETWDDRVIVEGVDLKIDTDRHYVEVTTHFRIKSFSQVLSHVTTITA